MTNSKKYVIQSPMSFTGSARRLWLASENIIYRLLVAFILMPLAWSVIALWYLAFGVLVIPYRLFRRGQRKNKLAQLRHDEIVDEISRRKHK